MKGRFIDMKANKAMKDLMKDIKKNATLKTIIDFNQLFKLLNPKIKSINGCLFIDNNEKIKPDKLNFKEMLKLYGDKTGCEASYNEIRVNDFVHGNTNSFADILSMGFFVLDIWGLKLKYNFPDSSFCLIMSVDEEYVILRFHKVRGNEISWLADDIEGYKEPVAFNIV